MKNKSEIINALRCATSLVGCRGADCPYYVVEDDEAVCDTDQLMLDAAALLESDGWIPVTERLPEADEWVRVTAVTPDGTRYTVDTYYNGECWGYVGSARVIAWQPRPEAYKEESR